jgi:CBS domain-containing protein
MFAYLADMKLTSIMTSGAKTCRASDTLEQATKLMWDHDIGAVVVVDEHGQVVGMVTDRDACMAAYMRGLPLGLIPVEVAMSSHVVTCQCDDSPTAVARLMAKHKIHRIPVIDDAHRPVGVVALNDLAIAMTRMRDIPAADVAATLAAICEHRMDATA